ncbi:MAG: acyl-CoA thioesterase [Anaerolineae bacterium]|nr:acyl-CoA thioesterase [Anaerolineae bacterium]
MDGFRHITPIEVRFRDLDVFGHVNNGVIFTYIETARIRYLVDVDIRSPQAGWNDIAFILAHINCDFRQPIFYGQRVEVGSRIVEIGRTSMRLAHRVEVDGKLAAEGDGILVHYDYPNQRSTPISAEMRAKIEAFEQGSKVAE